MAKVVVPKCCRGRRPPASMAKAARLNAVLADVNRLRILCLLKDGERCVCEIWRDLALPQNLASHHLKALKSIGLLRSRKDGLRVFYSIDKALLRCHLKSLESLIKKG